MKKVLLAAVMLVITAVISMSGAPVADAPQTAPATTRQVTPAATANQPASAAPAAAPAAPEAYQAMVTRYCVGCHNTRNPLPAGLPLALDSANLADPGANAATWERVVKKLGVGAMPPQGSPRSGCSWTRCRRS